MEHVLCLTSGFLAIAGLAGPAFPILKMIFWCRHPAVSRPSLNSDTGVDARGCLIEISSFDAREGTTHDGQAYPIAEVESDRYSMMIHYTGGGFPDAALNNWPLSIDLNFGGSGWFSYLLVLVETRAGKIGSGFVQQAGDRCNDGYARWDGLPKTAMASTCGARRPSGWSIRLDGMNWRAVENAMMFDGKDETAREAEMLTLADPPLYRSWLPLSRPRKLRACCVGEIVVMHNMIGSEVEPDATE